MLGKVGFTIVGFITVWIGLVLMVKGYAVPGVAMMGVGLSMFRVIYPTEKGEI